MAKLLLVEDDDDLALMLRDWLRSERHVVDVAHDARAGRELLAFSGYDIIILDWELPDGSGIEICKGYRAAGGTTPILMLTGRSAVKDVTTGLDCGADDYLTKPFNVEELSARLRSLLRRVPEPRETRLIAGELTLDPLSRKVTRAGQDIQLLPKEFDLLHFLMRHPNQIFSTDALIHRVWTEDRDVSAQAVFTCIKRLRKRLGDEEEGGYIANVHGYGYKFDRLVETSHSSLKD